MEDYDIKIPIKNNKNVCYSNTHIRVFKKINNNLCSWSFINSNNNIYMGKLVPNMSNIFGVEKDFYYKRIITNDFIFIKKMNNDEVANYIKNNYNSRSKKKKKNKKQKIS